MATPGFPPVAPAPDAADALERAVRHGLAQASPARVLAGADETLAAWLLSDECLDSRESGRHLLAARLRARAMTAARAGDGDRADVWLREACRLGATPDSSPIATAVATTLDEAMGAYLAYRRGRIDEARARLLASLAATDRVHEVHPMPTMHLRRVHLVANLVRVEGRLGEVAEAARLGARLIGYLEGDEEAWPLPTLPPRQPIAALALALRVRSADRLTIDLAPLFDRLTAGDDTSAFAPHLGAADACAPFAWSHAWLRYACARHAEDPAWPDAACELLALGAWPAPALWRDAALRTLAHRERLYPDDGALRARVAPLLDAERA